MSATARRDALPVHFWLPHEPDRSFREWIPDLEPGRYTSGVSHRALELYKRLVHRGRPVTIGPVPPQRSHIVFHLESVWLWMSMTPALKPLGRLLAVLVRHGVGTAIRGDVPLTFSVRLQGVIEVMPNRSSIARESQAWLPLLPQRGMIPRSEKRFGGVESAALVGFGKSIPDYFRSADFLAGLERLGMRMESRVADGPSDNPDWHDFEEIDSVIAVRRDFLNTGFLRKPATALINAWVAGAIPIVAREPAFLELARPDEDCLFVSGVDDVLRALQRLRSDNGLISRLETGGRERAREFSRERVTDLWEGFLFSRQPSMRSGPAAAGAARLWTDLAVRRVAGAGKWRAGRLLGRALG